MKKQLILLILLIIAFKCTTLIAQTDSTLYFTNDTCIRTTLTDYDKLLRHILPEKQEVTKLYKVNLLQLAKKEFNLSIEQKLRNNWSLDHEIIIHSFPYNLAGRKESPNKFFNLYIPNEYALYYLILSTNVRFYHNLDKRIKKGKNINGFAGNYFTMGATAKIGIYDPETWHISQFGNLNIQFDPTVKNKTMFSWGKTSLSQSIIYANAGYGLQRRIGNVGYWGAEIKMGVGTNKYFNTLYIVPEINAKLGFGLTSLRFKRK